MTIYSWWKNKIQRTLKMLTNHATFWVFISSGRDQYHSFTGNQSNRKLYKNLDETA